MASITTRAGKGSPLTNAEVDANFTNINTELGQKLTGNQTVTLSGDVTGSGATAITATLANSGVTAGTYTKVTVDGKGRVTTGASIASSDVTTALGYTPYNSSNPAGYLTGITGTQVTTALGYTPYNSSNPSGYITSSALSSYLPLSGGTVSGGTTFSSTVYFGTDIQLTRSDVSPALLFTSQNQWRWIYTGGGNYWQANLSIVSGGNNIAINGNAALHTGNYNSYALPLSGGTLTGQLTTAYSGARHIITDGTNTLVTGLWDGSNVRLEASGRPLYVVSYGGAVTIGRSSGSQLTIDSSSMSYGGNAILHAGNYSSYALPLSGGIITGPLTYRSVDSGSGEAWHDQLHLGRYDARYSDGGYPNYLPGAAFGLHVNQSSDAVFFGLISRGANSNDYNAVIAWGDDSPEDVLQFRFNNGTVATLTPSGAFNAAGSLTQAGNQVLHAGNWTNYISYSYSGWPGYPGTDANTFYGGNWVRSSFTYSNNAPHTGTIVNFPSGGYELQLNGTYNGQSLSFRNRQGDTASWNTWRTVIHDGNYSSYALPLSGGTMTGALVSPTGQFRKSQTAGNYTTAALWTESYDNTATGIAFHISGNVGKFLEMRTNGILYWNGDTVIHSGNYNSWVPSLTGSGASGTWGISITGNAATVGGYSVGTSTNQIPYLAGTRNLVINNPESYSGEVRLGAAWDRGGLYASNGVSVGTSGSFIDHVHSNITTMRHLWDSESSRLVIGRDMTTTPYTLIDGNQRPGVYIRGSYPFLTLDGTAASNGSHGPTIQFTHDGGGARQWVVGTNGTGTRIDFGYADSGTGNSNYNPHNGISGYNGTTWMTVRNNGRIGFGWEGDWGDYGTNGEPLYPFHFIGSHQNSHTYLFRNASNASNGAGAIFVNNNGNHSWGVVSEFRIDGDAGSDRPSILFSTGYNSDTWSVGFGYTDSNFRIRYDHGHRNGGWGTTALEIDRGKRTYIHQGALYQSSDWNSAFNSTPTSSRTFHGDVSSGGPTGTWWFYDSMRHSNGSNYWGTQIAYGWEDNANNIYQRNVTGGNWSGWVRYLNSSNYSSYALPLSGGTVTGSTTFNSAVVIGGRDTRYFENDSFKEFYVAGDANTYYPVLFSVSAWFHFARWSISRAYHETAPWDPIGTGVHHGGLTLTWEWSGDGAWGGNNKTIRVTQFAEDYTTMVGGLALSVNGIIVWLRGGNAYYRFHGPGGVMNGATPYYSTFTASDGSTYSPRSYNSGTVASEVTARMPIRGVAELYDGNNRVLHAGNYTSYAVSISNNSSLNSDSRNTRGVTRLYRRDSDSDYSVQTYWTGSHWYLGGYSGDSYHADCRVAYADTAGSVSGGLTTSNYSSYALPLSGGSVSGAINLTNRLNGILVNASSTASDGGSIAIQQVTGEGWTGIFADYEPYTGWGLWHDNPNNYFCFTSESSTGGLRSFAVPSRVSGNRTAYEKLRVDQNNGDIRVGGAVYISTSGHLALHAGNYSSYALPLGGGTVTGEVSFTKSTYPVFIYGNANTGSASAVGLQVYSTGGNGAIMAFHRGGYYAVNMGLDSDNVIRIGGWSASANRWQLDMSGNGTYAGNVTAYSDERLKKDWSPIESGFVDRLASILAGTYTRIDSGERQAGVSAQKMREILPEVVSEDNEGTLALAYGNAAMVSAVELAKEIVNLKREIELLKSKLH